jgi:hypothetical protein
MQVDESPRSTKSLQIGTQALQPWSAGCTNSLGSIASGHSHSLENAQIRLHSPILAAAILVCILFYPHPLRAQDDVTTQNASSALDGGWITGPASNPLSLLNGPVNRTYGSAQPYDLPDFHPAADLDAHLPKWLRFEAEERFRYEGYENGDFVQGNDDSYLLNRFRFQADLRFRSWFNLVSQVQDARPFLQKPPVGPPNENLWDLKLAYAELGDPERHWFSLRVGRQEINYNNTLIANSEWRNQGRSYDAAVTNLHYQRYYLGVFAASAVIPQSSGLSHHQQGNNIYGLYGRVVNPFPNSSLEPFVLWRVQPKFVLEPALSTQTGKEDMWTYGLRLKGRTLTSLDYSIEAAMQKGKDGPEQIRAWGLTGGAGYEFGSNWGDPRIFTQYDFASGNPNPGDGVHRTFDTMYPTAHDRFGIVDQFGWQNIRAVRGGGTITPRRRWTVTLQFLDLWVPSTADAVYNSSGGAIVHGIVPASVGNHLGQEFDTYSWYELNRHLNIGGGYGRFGAGAFLSELTTGHTYSYPYFAINFKDHGRARNR